VCAISSGSTPVKFPHHNNQGEHLSGKPGNVREFDSCQGNVRDFTKSQGNASEKSCQGKVA